MSDIDWAALAEPFPEHEIKHRPGAATWEHKEACQGSRCRETRDPDKHIQFSYVDARVVQHRLDEVLTPAGWDFTWTNEGDGVVHGRLIVGGSVKEDAGYPNSDRDEEPYKAAVSDALKRCAVHFGVGRHLYEENKAPRAVPARQAAPRQAAPPRPRVVDNIVEDGEDEENPFDAAPANARDTYITCALHGVKWAGEPGDLWHKTDDPNLKGYCRHPENLRKAR